MGKHPENTLILTTEPFIGFMPDDVRNWLQQKKDNQSLASALAAVHNHVGCLGHDLDEDNDPWIMYAFDEWWELEKELYASAFNAMKAAVQRGEAHYDLNREGLYYRVLPFMEKNGFRDGQGWFV